MIAGYQIFDLIFDDQAFILMCLLALGGFVAMPVASFFAVALVVPATMTKRFAGFFILLSAGTIGFQALLFGLLQRSHYWPWLDPLLTPRGIIQLILSLIVSAGQFAAFAIKITVPLGTVFLFVAAIFFTFRTRQGL